MSSTLFTHCRVARLSTAGSVLLLLIASDALASPWASDVDDVAARQAVASANLLAWKAGTPRRHTAGSRSNASHPLGIQTLSVEANRTKRRNNASTAKEIRVYQYDHTTETSRLVTIDSVSQLPISQHHLDSVHLPLNTNEIRFAKTLLEQHSAAMTRLTATRQDRDATLAPSLDGLNAKAVIFEPDDPLHLCATTRCALLALFDDHYRALPVEPVVVFSSQSVTWLDAR